MNLDECMAFHLHALMKDKKTDGKSVAGPSSKAVEDIKAKPTADDLVAYISGE